MSAMGTMRLPFDAVTMQEQMQILIDEDALDSAELVGEMLLSAAAHNDVSIEFYRQTTRSFGDAMSKKKEFKRAIASAVAAWTSLCLEN